MSQSIKMTKLANCAGCGAKVGAGLLSRLLTDFKTRSDPALLVGFDTSDDAAVYKISDDLAIVQTLDFFPPIVDDPYTFGQIAAANAISDVYAMGGTPKIALNIMTVCDKMGDEATREVLRGGYDKAFEAEVIIAGGHTIRDEEPKYGLSVTGFVNPTTFYKNSTANEGDVLILTKALGVGIIMSAVKAGYNGGHLFDQAVSQMTMLNKKACEIMGKYNIHGCTDVTGFSLLGHSLEMARGAEVAIEFSLDKIPIIDGTAELAKEENYLPGGIERNRNFAQNDCDLSSVEEHIQSILFDPQTSGGLLIAVDETDWKNLEKELSDSLPCARAIGHVRRKKSHEKYIFVK